MVACFVVCESESAVQRSDSLYDNVSRGFFLGRIIYGVGSDECGDGIGELVPEPRRRYPVPHSRDTFAVAPTTLERDNDLYGVIRRQAVKRWSLHTLNDGV